MTQEAGYSGKPLHAKLGFKPGYRVLLCNPPSLFDRLLDGAEGVSLETEGNNDPVGPFDAVHLFLTRPPLDPDEIAARIALLREGGMLWLSWAKKSSPLFNGITEDDLRRAVLPLGWVDTKVCAVDRDWSGLKFLRRRTA